jgi:uncharacterized membrane protein YccC
MTFKEYITSEDTETAFRFIAGAALPMLVCTWLGYTEMGIFMLLGATFVFGIDIPIALPKKLGFMVLSGLLSACIFVLFTQVQGYPLLNGILLLSVLFVLNFVSPFSPNFSIVALFLNLSVMIGLSMADSIDTLDEALLKARYLLLGSGWYILYALLLHPLQRPRQIRRRLLNCLRLTAEYLDCQATLLDPAESTNKTLLDLSKKQSEIVAMHQQIREVLLREPIDITSPETFMGQATYILANLVDLDELATASALSFQAIADRPEKDELLPLLRTLNGCVVSQLREMEVHLEREDQAHWAQTYDRQADEALQELNHRLDDLKIRSATKAQSAEAYRQLRRIQRYTEQQLLLLENMRNVLAQRNVSLDLAREQLPRFAIYDTLEWNFLRSHLSLQSGFFRYALRIALTAVGAYYLAAALGFGYPSWALLTVLVILKPGFHLSRQRLAHRVYGTLAGLMAGLLLYYLLQPGPWLSMSIFLVSQFFAFSYIKRQYAVTTGFFTLFILFFYSYLQREFMDAAYFRLLDTLMAAALCWLAMRFVFPYWEVQNLPAVVRASIRANRNLLNNVLEQADAGERDATAYKLHRKEAFLKMDDLLNSYRLVQTESSSKTELINTTQYISLLIYTQLSQIISLGLFLKRTPNYQWQDPEVRQFLQETLAGLDSLVAPEQYAPSAAQRVWKERKSQELTHRRREIDRLLLNNSHGYLPRVHELYWLETAYELMDITDKLRDKLSPQPQVATSA